MQDWNPDLYRQFEAERTRPAQELLSRVSVAEAREVTDLGCGPGNSTELLWHAWPQAKVVGVDSSPAMLDQARQRLPDCQFVQADIRGWHAQHPQDVIYANASLQWLSDHTGLLPHLANQLAAQGVLAVQMPDNLQEPSHRLMREVAARAPWRDKLGQKVDRQQLLTAGQYYDLLVNAGCQVDIWRTTYYHQMPSAQAIIDWLRATGLRPFLEALDPPERQTYLHAYLHEISQAYPSQADGAVLLAFPRLFIVAQRR
ncbi:Trans-aconitate 2-methyltransferase [Paramixta manurensis]|uniref:Trans-aconitate 2-methyltransferase n=1 Tax=Paramixta manurensis TaxID=2740817 RepID=A0A6M8UCG6_9GAMM|nr:Trans-aconitate 2-methyltransferase [Erwiniaceae bacterium PD-1]